MPGDVAFRVATFNIRNGLAWDGLNSWPFRRRRTLNTLIGLDADLIALQEAYRFQLRWLARHLPGCTWVGEGRRGGRRGEHTAVLVRTDTTHVVEHRTRWFGDTPDRPGTKLAGARFARIATTVVVALESGLRLRFTSTHLDERSADRRDQSAAQLIEWVGASADTPHVVAGDFNAAPEAAMFDAFAFAGLRSALPATAGGTVHRFTGRHDGRRLDHILVSDTISVLDGRVVVTGPEQRLASDHWPVVADLVLRGT